MVNKCVIVQGLGESTGCRLLTSALIDVGLRGAKGHHQPFDGFISDYNKMADYFKQQDGDCVIRFSYPHNLKCINLFKLYEAFKQHGTCKEMYFLFTTRFFPAQIISVKQVHHKNDTRDSIKNSHKVVKMAYLDIFKWLLDIINNDYDMKYNFIVLNLMDFIQFPVESLEYIKQAFNLDIDCSKFDISQLRNDVNIKRVKEYFEEK